MSMYTRHRDEEFKQDAGELYKLLDDHNSDSDHVFGMLSGGSGGDKYHDTSWSQ